MQAVNPASGSLKVEPAANVDLDVDGRAFHSSTFRLNLSAFCGIGVHLWVV